MTQPMRRRVAVIGGGVAGLAAIVRLHDLASSQERPLEMTLFEASPRLGGIVGTRSLAGYRVETGADSFITNKPWAVALCRRLGLEERLIPTDERYRRSLVLRRGTPVAVPDGFQLLAPVDVGAVLKSPIFSWRGKLRMALEYLLPRGGTDQPDESLAHFVRRRFGREALDRLVQPLVGGIYTSDPERLSLRATMPRFLEMEREHRSLIRALRRQAGGEPAASGARYGLFTTPRNGISELIDTLAALVSHVGTVRLDTPIARLTRGDTASIVVEPVRGEPLAFDAVIVATPAYAAADLISPLSSAGAAPLRRIEYASTAIVVSGHRLSDVQHPLDAFGLVVPAIERRKILAVSFTSRKFPDRAPAGCVQLRTFVGGAMQPELMQLSDDQIVGIVRSELESILGVTWRPDFTLVARWNRSMPQYHVGHLELVAQIERELEALPRLALAGSAYHGVGLPDSIHSGELAAERVFAVLGGIPPKG
ncbi:MAG: protoporphyrinogen oxidase [Planctomycetales bacterium]